MSEVIKRESLVDQVYSVLREQIISLRFPLGSHLNVNEIKNELNVSSTPIREAVNRLIQEELIEYENNVGATVIALDDHDVEEINQLAGTLHKKAIQLAIDYGDRASIVAELSSWLKAYKAAKTPEEEVNAVFHFIGTYYRSCGNRRLHRSMINIQGQQVLLRNIYAACREERGADAHVFEEMLRATEEGDSDSAYLWLKKYTNDSQKMVKEYIHEHYPNQRHCRG